MSEIEGCVVVERVAVGEHVFLLVDSQAFVCDRCGLAIVVPADSSPTRALEGAVRLWAALGRECV